MDENLIKQLHLLIENRNQAFVVEVDNMRSSEWRKNEMHKKRGARIVRSFVKGDIIRTRDVEENVIVDYLQQFEHVINLKEDIYVEEYEEYRRAVFKDGKLVKDMETTCPPHEENVEHEQPRLFSQPLNQRTKLERTSYDRREAVRYAERWWNDYNPAYRKFTDNCTNFISQCMRAGGAEMTGYPDRSSGWWYKNENWSYSWSVAHSFRWYLSGATGSFRGEERESATDLEPGDVICYDFDGDGRWQHTTIVVAKDANGEPLVNAQTSNSRMRYWKYEDSTAWTPNIQYKFFHIV